MKKAFKILLVLAILGSIGIGILVHVMSDMVILRPDFQVPRQPPTPGASEFSTTNPKGETLYGWWYPGEPGSAAILLCHGHSVDHNNVNDMIPFLRTAGFSCLSLDFRAHGRSDGFYTSIGLREWEDVDAILKKAGELGYVPASMPLAAYGRSMGAATLINGSARLPQIRAFVLESSFAELRKIASRDFQRMTGIPDNPLIDLAFCYSEWRTGVPYSSNRPVEAITGVGSRPVMLIHDGKDPRATREDHDRLAAAVPHAKTLIFPDSGHVAAHKPPPCPFESEFLSFLSGAGITASGTH